MVDNIGIEALEESFERDVRDICDNLADMCFRRIMANPKEGFRFLSYLATTLDCKLAITFECSGGEQ
jgi:hypothetical protein